MRSRIRLEERAMNENIIKWIQEEVKEFTNGQYIAEVMSSPTEKYKHMEADFADSLLRAMSFMCEEITGESLPLDELFPAMANGLLFRGGSYESSEFIRSLMDKYEQELKEYKASRSGEITKEMRLSAEIDGMDIGELVIAIAKAHGISIYDYEWPCYYFATEMFAMTPEDLSEGTAEEIDRDQDIVWPVTCLSGCGKGETPMLEPLSDYSDITPALCLVSDLKAQEFRLSTRESLVDKTYTCSFARDEPHKTLVSGHSKRLPVAISKAYLKVLLFELNPDAIRRVFDETNTIDSNDVEETTST